MVIPNWTGPRPPKIEFERMESEITPNLLARPLDRLAAVIVDVFVLLVPIFILLSSPLKRMVTASFILGAEGELVVMGAAMITLALTLIVLYQGLMHYYFGATVGKMIFKMKVVAVFPDVQITLMGSLLRALVWLSELLLLGLPLLAVFSNSKRRTLHDRICDTVVVTRNEDGVLSPAQWERGLVRGFLAFCLTIFGLIGFVQIRQLAALMTKSDRLVSIIESELKECEVVSENLGGDSADTSRLHVAMSLYAAGLADRTCLQTEISREATNRSANGPLSYLAQAFVHAEDAELSNTYLDQVCEEAPESVECSMSSVISQWSDENWDGVESALRKAKKGSGYLEVWGIRHFMKQGQYEEVLSFLDILSTHRELAEFSLVQRVKALYNSYLVSEASVALAQALPTVSPDEAMSVSEWMCVQQLQSGCDALSELACKQVQSEKSDIKEVDFENAEGALAQIMTLECQVKTPLDYLSFSESVRNQDWQTFFRANIKQQKGDKSASFALFADVMKSGSAPEMLKIESMRRASLFADRKELAVMLEVWSGLTTHETWSKVGNILFRQLARRNDSDSAMRVAHDLMKSKSLAPDAIQFVDAMSTGPVPLRTPSSLPPEDGGDE